MKAEAGIFFLCVLVCGFSGAAALGLDQDFSVLGDGADAPSELSVYRRFNGFTVVVRCADGTDRIRIYFDCDNATETGEMQGASGADYRLNADGTLEKYHAGAWQSAGRVRQLSVTPEMRSFHIRDSELGVTAETLIGVVCSNGKSGRLLPDVSNGPLLVSGSRKNPYSRNLPDNTILRQVSNGKVTFRDPEGDITDAAGDDLLAGCAEIRDDQLFLSCRLAAPLKNKLRIWIDSVPCAGYSTLEADFLIDDTNLLRYTGGDTGKWRWEKCGALKREVAEGGMEVHYTLPLNRIRPQKYGRLRVCFQTAPDMERGDSMPSRGKVLPVLRPGNLAAAPGTRIEVSSTYPKYKIYPLTDGQTARQIYYSYAAWASADISGMPQFADFIFQKEESVNLVSVWWEKPPREIEIFAKKGGEWHLLLRKAIPENEDWSNIPLPENSRAEAVRVRMPAGKGHPSRPNLLWIREVEIY